MPWQKTLWVNCIIPSSLYYVSNLSGAQYANLCWNSQVRCPLIGRGCIWFARFTFDFSYFADVSDDQVTNEVIQQCREGLKNVDIGIFTLHCLHTSAGLTVSLFSGCFVAAIPAGSLAYVCLHAAERELWPVSWDFLIGWYDGTCSFTVITMTHRTVRTGEFACIQTQL